MKNNKDSAPETISVSEYLRILRNRRKRAREKKLCDRQRRRGMWYCAHCDTMHGKRVVEYQIADGLVDSVCSIGCLAYLEYNPALPDDEQFVPEDFRPLVAGQELEGGE